MPSVTFDVRGLIAFTKDLERDAAIAPVDAAKVVGKAAQNIKRDARQRVRGIRHAPAYPWSIDYDPVHIGRTAVQTLVGPNNDKRQGGLGNILEYGTVHNAPIPHLAPAAEAEEPRFAAAMEALAVKALSR
jgi:hypothetical protein